MEELPYDFDLYYDIKTMEEVERVFNYEPSSSSASPYDLVRLFKDLGMPLPSFVDRATIIARHRCHIAALTEEIEWLKSNTYEVLI